MKLRIFYLVPVVVLLGLLSSIIFLSLKNEKDEIKKVADSVKGYFDKSLEYEKVNLLSLALALAENCDLKSAIISDDEEVGHDILARLSSKFKKYTHMQDMKLQVMTHDRFLFARSWESGFSSLPLWWFRDDLDDLQMTHQPKSGIEIGMMLTLRATVPIYKEKKVIGYLETIKLLDELSSKLRLKGIELFVLMDIEYLEKASLMRENSSVDEYILANMNASKNYFDRLKHLSFSKLKREHLVYDSDVLFVYEPMYNSRGKKLGMFVLAVPPESYQKIANDDSMYLFMQDFDAENLSSVVKTWKKPLGSFKEYSHREIIDLLPRLHTEDRVEFENRARGFLQDYSKEELIDIILNSETKMKKVGEIK